MWNLESEQEEEVTHRSECSSEHDKDLNEEKDHGKSSKKKRRKLRLYCVCRGASFGNMIACDNKGCLDRSNWYHMDCVRLDPAESVPEIWFCPSCEFQAGVKARGNRT